MRTVLTDTGGWFPFIDSLAKMYDPTTALVFGVVFRYCQRFNGICDVSIDTIARIAHVSRSTAKRKLRLLTLQEYLVDMTPSERHRPHYYKTTDKISMETFVVDLNQMDEVLGEPDV
jgi:hypothetical protein